ncbi:MAG: hypothetical protein AAGC64_11645 [Bacteroidota bacterium]
MMTSRDQHLTEIQHLTNAKVFDFYGVQRPGRMFYMSIPNNSILTAGIIRCQKYNLNESRTHTAR